MEIFNRFKKFFPVLSLVVLSVSSLVIANYAIKINQENRSQAAASDCPSQKDVYDIEKDFGANGRDQKDDYDAILKASKCLSRSTGKTLNFPAGTFRVDRYVVQPFGSPPTNGVERILYNGAKKLRILGAGAADGGTRIELKGDIHLTADSPGCTGGDGECFTYSSQNTPFRFKGCEQCLVSGFTIDGNKGKMTKEPGVIGAPGSSCIQTIGGNKDLTISDVNGVGCIEDGLDLRAVVDHRVTVINSRFYGNGRQGVSVEQARKVTFVNNYFGTAVPFPPGKAVDIEPHTCGLPPEDETDNILFYNSTIVPDNPHEDGEIYIWTPNPACGGLEDGGLAMGKAADSAMGYKDKLRLLESGNYGNCSHTDVQTQIGFVASRKDYDEDGVLDDTCFQLFKDTVEFGLPAESKRPKSVRLFLNGTEYEGRTTISGNKILVDTLTLPNGHWKMTFAVRDVDNNLIQPAPLPAIIANERPSFDGPTASPNPSPSPSVSPSASPSPSPSPTPEGDLVCKRKATFEDDPRNRPGAYYLEKELERGTSVNAGQTIVYLVDFVNKGTKKLNNVKVTDKLSAKLEFIDADGGCNFTAASREVSCVVGELLAGEGTGQAIRVKIKEGTPDGAIANKAFVRSGAKESSCGTLLNIGEGKVGDINGDGRVNILDYSILFENFGKRPVPNKKADINKDDKVDILDYSLLFENFGK